MNILGNKRKIASVIKCEIKLHEQGWDVFRVSLLQADTIKQLQLLDDLPGIGTAARYQLAGAIGIDVAKPDRHLLRLASKYGYSETEDGVKMFTNEISEMVGETVKVVDYVLWRYAEGSSYRGRPS